MAIVVALLLLLVFITTDYLIRLLTVKRCVLNNCPRSFGVNDADQAILELKGKYCRIRVGAASLVAHASSNRYSRRRLKMYVLLILNPSIREFMRITPAKAILGAKL
nr:hypothetical protein [Tanacetum cinerariifolium]